MDRDPEETIELSLASLKIPKNSGPHNRELLGVLVFFPQGINEYELDWLYPIVDKFRFLSFRTHRRDR